MRLLQALVLVAHCCHFLISYQHTLHNMADSTAALETSGTSSNDVDVNPRGIPKAAFIVSGARIYHALFLGSQT